MLMNNDVEARENSRIKRKGKKIRRMATNTSRYCGSEASMSDVKIASLAAVIKKIEHACKQQPRLSVVHIEFRRKTFATIFFCETSSIL